MLQYWYMKKITAKKLFRKRWLMSQISKETWISKVTILRAVKGKATSIKEFEIYMKLIELGFLNFWEVTLADFWKP